MDEQDDRAYEEICALMGKEPIRYNRDLEPIYDKIRDDILRDEAERKPVLKADELYEYTMRFYGNGVSYDASVTLPIEGLDETSGTSVAISITVCDCIESTEHALAELRQKRDELIAKGYEVETEVPETCNYVFLNYTVPTKSEADIRKVLEDLLS